MLLNSKFSFFQYIGQTTAALVIFNWRLTIKMH